MERIEVNVKTKQIKKIPLTQKEIAAARKSQADYETELKKHEKLEIKRQLRENDIRAVRALLNPEEPESVESLKAIKGENAKLRERLRNG